METTQRQVSEKQLEANRNNALKSTGPKTEEGKKRSSRNAFRSGITGQVSVNTDEDRAAHAEFTSALIADLKPEGAIEQQISVSIAEGHWRLNRARAMEDNIFSLESFGPAGDIEVDDPEVHTAMTAAQIFLDRSKDLERLTLYEQRIHRTLQKDMAKLEALQANRKAEREAALEQAAKQLQVADFYNEAEPNGFEFSTEEIRRHIRLKRFAHHEKQGWQRKNEYPKAA